MKRKKFNAKKSKTIVKAKSTALAKKVEPQVLSLPEAVERVLISGDLTPLSSEQRLNYYKAVCASLGLNPLTKPFDYIAFKETDSSPPRLQLYARKDCSEQLRRMYGVGVTGLRREISDGMCIVEAQVMDKTGKTDYATGVVPLSKWKDGKVVALQGKELANAIMKAETKAKRRATLSICGLGFLDESELDNTEPYASLTPQGRVMYELAAGNGHDAAQEVARRKIGELKESLSKPPKAEIPAFTPEPEPAPQERTLEPVASSSEQQSSEKFKVLDVSQQKKGSAEWMRLKVGEGGTDYISCWHRSMWPFLQNAKGRECEFVIRTTKGFRNVEFITKIGRRRFGLDGLPERDVNEDPKNLDY